MKNLKFLSRGVLWVFLAGLGTACQQPTATVNSNSGVQPNAPLANPNAPAANQAPAPQAPNPEDSMPRISVEEAKAAVDKGSAVIIDVRGPDAYKAAHVKGATEHSLSRLEQGDFKDLPKNKRIIAYCS